MEQMMNTVETPIGRLLLAADDAGLCAVRRAEETDCAGQGDASPVLARAACQLKAYFAGELRAFDLPLSVHGTAFERAVWQTLAQIPYGSVQSYGQIAEQLGRPGAARAVGAACGRNPLLIVVPCHRVVASSGALTGFAAGMEAKRLLLAREGWAIRSDRISI